MANILLLSFGGHWLSQLIIFAIQGFQFVTSIDTAGQHRTHPPPDMNPLTGFFAYFTAAGNRTHLTVFSQ
jgi:hypothetical protein